MTREGSLVLITHGHHSIQGTHWIYDPKEMAAKVPSIDAPEFKDPPTPSFYNADEFPNHYGPGMLSPYGEQLLFVTEHIASTGKVDGTEMSNAMMKWSSAEYTGRKDHALKTFEENMSAGKTYPDCGADDNQGTMFPSSTLSIYHPVLSHSPFPSLSAATSSLLYEGGSRHLPLCRQARIERES
jgi:hypothetical protein